MESKAATVQTHQKKIKPKGFPSQQEACEVEGTRVSPYGTRPPLEKTNHLRTQSAHSETSGPGPTCYTETPCLTDGPGTESQLDHHVRRQTTFRQKPHSDMSTTGPTCCCRSRMPDTRSWTRLETVQQCSPTTSLVATTTVLGRT